MRHAETCEPVRSNSIIAEMHRAHQARQRRIRNAAIGFQEVEAVKTDNVQVDILEKRWAERQKENWFAIIGEVDPPRPSINRIQRVVAEHYGITQDDMISARRVGKLILPRHVAMSLCRVLTLRSYPEIGRRFGNRDHTVPIYACQKIDALAKSDPQVAADIEFLKSKLVAT